MYAHTCKSAVSGPPGPQDGMAPSCCPPSPQTGSLVIVSEALTQTWGEGKKQQRPVTEQRSPRRPRLGRCALITAVSTASFHSGGRAASICADLVPPPCPRPQGAAVPSPPGPRSGTRQIGNLIRRWNNAAVIECVIYLNGTQCDMLSRDPERTCRSLVDTD